MKPSPLFCLSFLLLASLFMSANLQAQLSNSLPVVDKNNLSLAGLWHFGMDEQGTGFSDKGIQLNQNLPLMIQLPGSTDQAGFGIHNSAMTSLRLTRSFTFKGICWYEKEFYVPKEWAHKELMLFLERSHWKTEVYVNGHLAGSRESLSIPHTYNITRFLKADQLNKIRISVDNSQIYDIGIPHAISEETQTNWNGIIGKISLKIVDPVHIQNIQVYPDIERHLVRVKVAIRNHTENKVDGNLFINVNTANTTETSMGVSKQVRFQGMDSLISVDVQFPLPDSVKLWSEFHPTLYKLRASMVANHQYAHVDSTNFGMRHFSTKGRQFMINGTPTFIRSGVHCAEFPLTAYPAMDLPYWLHLFSVCKNYGLNAMRFHTWCPPEAAFDAADQLGFYLQIENADWRFDIGTDTAADRFLTQEADRILNTYGNHPSFIMFCEGNELVGDKKDVFLGDLLACWKKLDNRHLYTGSSGYPIIPANDYEDLYGPRAQHWKEGLKGRLNAHAYRTDFDYSKDIQKYEKPVISHEVGQWCVYPDYSQISKYTGVLQPHNYILFRESLRKHHMLWQAEQFSMASGKFQVIQKKEELEALLRTPELGGYQLLELQDFPGQGTAPVGVVDMFWDPKPYTDSTSFKQFQSSRVLLWSAPSVIYTNDQKLEGAAMLANYGETTLKQAQIRWSLAYSDGRAYAGGNFPVKNIPNGGPMTIDNLSIDLSKIKKATRLNLILSLDQAHISNQWGIWVYPKTQSKVAGNQNGFIIAHSWNSQVKKQLASGKRVLILADTAQVNSDIPPSFSGISWNSVWSDMPPNLLGILCNPSHPALKHFPTEFHSNWQWWDLVRHSRPMLLDSLPYGLTPIIQMIPDWNKNNKIGLLFEGSVGPGKLLICSMDLIHELDKRPVARQMLYSLQSYMSSSDFNPKNKISPKQIEHLFKN